jgi:3-deoxy-manno-octulosonate cytidylyltransferase (CMP-KDO synthetase)
VPWARDAWGNSDAPESLPEGIVWYRHIGLYGYRAGLLADFVRWCPAPTEQAESLEQLRALYNGAPIHVAVATEAPPAGVDTEADLQRLRDWMETFNGDE